MGTSVLAPETFNRQYVKKCILKQDILYIFKQDILYNTLYFCLRVLLDPPFLVSCGIVLFEYSKEWPSHCIVAWLEGRMKEWVFFLMVLSSMAQHW